MTGSVNRQHTSSLYKSGMAALSVRQDMDVGADVGQIRRLHAQPLCHSDRDNARQTLETELDLTACQRCTISL